jgi:hypothetical protein
VIVNATDYPACQPMYASTDRLASRPLRSTGVTTQCRSTAAETSTHGAHPPRMASRHRGRYAPHQGEPVPAHTHRPRSR